MGQYFFMMINLIYWNVRGARNKECITSLRKKVRKVEPSVVAIQETKMEFLPEDVIRHIWGNRPCGWEAILSQEVERLESIEGSPSLSIMFRNRDDNAVWAHMNVYRTVNHREKPNF